MFYTIYDSPVGQIGLFSDGKNLLKLKLHSLDFEGYEKDDSFFQKEIAQLDDYFSGKSKKMNLDLQPKGTDFQKKVWEVLAKIPYGMTLSYQDVADQIGNPKAVRAVGAACGKNPFPILIPCHRVLASDGKLGGFTGGLDLKRKLLKIEGVFNEKR